jgi:hypothetical protein
MPANSRWDLIQRLKGYGRQHCQPREGHSKAHQQLTHLYAAGRHHTIKAPHESTVKE